MKKILFLSILFFVGCFDQKVKVETFDKARFIQKVKESNLTMNDLIDHLFVIGGFSDDMPATDIDANFYIQYKEEKNFYPWDKSKIEIYPKFVLMLFEHSRDYPSIALTFKKDATLKQVLLIEDHFGNNEFTRERTYERKGRVFVLTDSAYETEWEEYPIKGKRVLSDIQKWKIELREDGTFRLK